MNADDRLGKLAGLVQGGRISIDEALARVRRDPEFLAGTDLASLSEVTWGLARTHRSFGVPLTLIAHEWASTHRPNDIIATSTAFVRAATEVLTAHDDVRLYERATRAAERLTEAAGTVFAHFWAAMLHQAPYALDPANTEYGLHRIGRVANLPAPYLEDETLPAPEVGLGRAAHHLDLVLRVLSGPQRGMMLTHRAFVEYSRHEAGLTADLEAVDRWCAEADRLLPPGGNGLVRNRLVWLTILRETFTATRPVILPDPEAMDDGLVNTVLIGTTAVRCLSAMAATNELRQVVDLTLPLVSEDPQLETQRRFLELATVHCLPDDPTNCLDHQKQRLAEPPSTAALLHSLLHRDNPEDQYDEYDEKAASVLEEAEPRLAHAANLVWTHRATRQARFTWQDGPAAALPALARAVEALALTGYPGEARFWFGMLTTMITKPGQDLSDVDRSFVDDLLDAADVAYGAVGEQVWRFVRLAMATTLNLWVADESLSVEQVFDLAVSSKGRGLAGALASPGPAVEQPAQQDFLRELAEQVDEDDFPREAFENSFLVAYLQSAEIEPGATVRERRANLRRGVLGVDVARMMMAALSAPVRSLQETQEVMPPDTVLMLIVLGESGMRAAARLHAILVSRDTVIVRSVGGPGLSIRERQAFKRPGETMRTSLLEVSSLGMEITELRSDLIDDPLHRVVTRAGQAGLEMVSDYLTAELLTTLDEFAGSRTRLIIWPQESLYFLPFQLVPFHGGLLADRFEITTIPSLEPLFRERRPARLGVLAVACAAGGLPAGLHDEPMLHEQASRIAELLGTTALLGDDATPAAVLERAGEYRFLHIAAHGGQEVEAPVFARVYLAGEPLHAYQILDCDLRGVELVTLCACESALLRYDLLDNVHGLAPAFLRAGAGAVVGALWRVEAEVADTFFTALYANLATGTQPVRAFGTAQRTTREHHPGYRDWGAFTYFGA